MEQRKFDKIANKNVDIKKITSDITLVFLS